MCTRWTGGPLPLAVLHGSHLPLARSHTDKGAPPMLNFQFQDASQALKAHSALDSELCPMWNPVLRRILICSQLPKVSFLQNMTDPHPRCLGKGLCPNPVFLGRDSFARFISHKARRSVPENLTDSRNHRLPPLPPATHLQSC